MKIFTDNDKIMIVQTITSANTFVSSITGIIRNYIMKVFPKDYFKYVYTDTSAAFIEHNKTDLNNVHLHKIAYPSLTISPQLSIDNPVGGMKNIMMSSPNFWMPRDLNRSFPVLLDDPDHKYKVYFTSDYTTFNLRFKIVVDSFIQATNIAYFLKSRFNDETFKYMNGRMLTVEMPKSFVNAIAKIEKLFSEDDEITNEEDLKTLDLKLAGMGRRAQTIMRKRSLNNNHIGYYFEEPANLLTLFTDLDIPEGVIRDNSVSGEYEINFRVQVSAWWPNAFILMVDKGTYQEIASSLVTGATMDPGQSEGFYSTSIGSPIALDRANTIYFSSLKANGESDNDQNIGVCVMHDILNYESSAPIDSINVANLIWGDD